MRIRPLLLVFFSAALAIASAEDITLRDGTVLKNATVTSVTPAYIGVTHAAGVAHVMLQDLAPELQKKYGYDKDKAANFAAADAAAQQRLAEQQAAERAKIAQQRAAEQAAPRAKPSEGSADTTDKTEYTLWGTITQIIPQGIVVDAQPYMTFVVKGMPDQNKAAEGDYFHASVVDAGTITLTDTAGAKRTLHAYTWRGPPK